MSTSDNEHLMIHIEGLQATLTKRNERIAFLEKKLADAEAGLISDKKIKAAYKRGFNDCCNRMMNSTQAMARQISDFRKDAFRVVMDGIND